jgi:beta-mannosidase
MAELLNPAGDLSGPWRLSSADGAHRAVIPVPGDVHSALQAAGIIPDPYVGENEKLVQWVAHAGWVLERDFTLAEAEGRWYLDLDYVDTVATVYVNEIKVLEADNCFRRYRPDVSGALKAGENRIRFEFPSSIEEGRKIYEAQPFEVPWQELNSPLPYGNMLRKPQCHFGWDWNIAIAPLGLYGTVALRKLETARIEHIVTRQGHNPDGSVDVTLELTLYAAEPCIAPVHLSFEGETVRLDCGLSVGETLIRHVFHVETPRLWWPAGSGPQELYTLSVEVAGETVTRQIGLRTVELVTTPDEAGSRFALRINGREIFCRGANWIPADALFSRTSRQKTEDLLRSAVDVHMNMIRIWGGGFYEHDWFYEICDRLGLMVWQDFMFACNLYPSTTDFLENVAEEVDYQVKRLISHPSIVLWCGDNELVGALTWFDVSRTNRDRYLVSYDRLNRTVETGLRKAAPEAIWWPSSPASGYLDYNDAWHADGSGDMHYWSVWHENKSFDNYRTVRPRFCSEFGFQSYTSMPVIRGFAGEGDLNIASPVIELHQKNRGGNERIAGTMFRYFRFPTSFEKFVYVSQVQQALAIQTAVDYWRSLKPHCMGTLYWQLNDTWPVASWASLDYGGGWKALHHAARRFFQPVHVVAIPEEGAVRLVAVNDTNEPVEIGVDLSALTLDGERRPLGRLAGTCHPDSAEELGRFDLAQLPAQSLLAWSFQASNGMKGEGHHVTDTYKALDLRPAGLSLDVRGEGEAWTVEVSATGLALFVMIETETSGRFSDNFFDLAAGETRRVTFTPAGPGEPPRFTLLDLHSSQSTTA